MATRILSEQELIARVLSAERKLARAVIDAIIAARGNIGALRRLSELIQSGRIQDAVEASVRSVAVSLSDASAAVYIQSGQQSAAWLGDALKVTVGFDQVHDLAVRRMRSNRLSLVREWTENQRDLTRIALREGVEQGLNPVAQARRFRQFMRGATGLTVRQHQAVENYRRLLGRVHDGDLEALTRGLRDKRFDRTLSRAAREGRPLTRQQIDRMVERYRQRAIKRRAETIARTEAMRSVHAGNRDAFEQAIEGGHIQVSDVLRTWVTAADERVRETHIAASGQRVGQNEPFTVGDSLLMYPGILPATRRKRFCADAV